MPYIVIIANIKYLINRKTIFLTQSFIFTEKGVLSIFYILKLSNVFDFYCFFKRFLSTSKNLHPRNSHFFLIFSVLFFMNSCQKEAKKSVNIAEKTSNIKDLERNKERRETIGQKVI